MCIGRFPRRTAVTWENRERPRNGGGSANIWATPNASTDETHTHLIENRRTRLERQVSTDGRGGHEKGQPSPAGGVLKNSSAAGTSPPNRVASASTSGSSSGHVAAAGAGNGSTKGGDRTPAMRTGSGTGGHEEDKARALLVPALSAGPSQSQSQPATLPLVNTAIMSTVRTSVQHAPPSPGAIDPSQPASISKHTQTLAGARAGPPPIVPPKPAHLAHYQRGGPAGSGAGNQGPVSPAAPLLAQVTFASSGSSTSTFTTHVNSNPNSNSHPNGPPKTTIGTAASTSTSGGAATQPLWTVVEAPSDLEYDKDRERDSGFGTNPRSPPHAHGYPVPYSATQAAYPVGYPTGSLGRNSSSSSGARTKPSHDGRILINLYDNLA